MQENDKILVRARDNWLREGMPDGKHEQHWELASQSMKERDRGSEPAVVTVTSGDRKAGELVSYEP